MRIYVSVDLEGIYRVDRYDTHENRSKEYRFWKKHVGQLMFEEVYALYEGLILKGASEVVVFDSHGGGDTILNLPRNYSKLTLARRVETHNELFPLMNLQVDGIILWGYHVKAGSKRGKLNHTASRRVKNVKINNREVGEVYLHGLYAFNKRIPLIAVSGDNGVGLEVKEDIGNIPFFNANIGTGLSRKNYLRSIKEFVLALPLDEVLKINQSLNWPAQTTLEVSYKNFLTNIARWILRKQFKHSRLKGLSSCIYEKGSFVQQWDQFNGFSS